ncbi:MarR family transcriptional regulator [Curtobacterium sp. ISL-83]|uniref:MarR family winged helix-turn-helix transcriptional regulator n=1 Tax=Curtobacterium sp. ISL-83 TaxID=2819145 RepID=UPI001BE5D35B|nr:MarR family transcriptional regulator [Curtobacterium sp. ISL-83]MBT2501289.1 MarR family transcriptional regulator [Curtobacterium sp. ISL-83]
MPEERDPHLGDAAADGLLVSFDAVTRAHASLVAQLSARAGVHETGFRALMLISDTGYSTPTELAGFLGLTSGAVTNMVDRLTASGLVERRPNPADRRGSLIRLTPAGTRVVDDARGRLSTLLLAVSDAHGQDLAAVLDDLANALLDEAVTVLAHPDDAEADADEPGPGTVRA